MPSVTAAPRVKSGTSIPQGYGPLPERIAAILQTVEERLLAPPIAGVPDRLAALGIAPADATPLLAGVHVAGRQPQLAELKERAGVPASDVTVERWLLLQAMRRCGAAIESLNVASIVKHLLCDEWEYMATPEDEKHRHFRQDHPRFAAMAKLATLRRMPAGLFHWEVGGIERRWLLRMPWRDLPRVLRVVTAMGGFDRMLMPHLNARRKSPWLTETAANRSYFLMAQALEAAPHLRGICANSWFRAPQIVEVAPHLSWVNRVFLDNGGVVTTIGPAGEDSGVFANNPQRLAMYRAGTFKPLIGLDIWPRDAAIAWMRAHPEYAPRTQGPA